ncbi:MAG: hypothetical protein ACI9Z3_000371 [Roseivirga sp.]|jgi:hypothetical protein
MMPQQEQTKPSFFLKIMKSIDAAIKITIPSDLKSGYYLIRTTGVGFSSTNRIIVQ